MQPNHTTDAAEAARAETGQQQPVVARRGLLGRLRARLFGALFRSRMREKLWTAMYNRAGLVPARDHVFMNLGYAPTDGEVVPETPDAIHMYAEAIYRHLVGTEPLEGRDVLEIGCGRGGGSAYLMRVFKPRRVVGLDRAEKLVERCRDLHHLEGLEFRQGDASHLPFADGSEDVVVNVESSHCYASLSAFYTEVARVLRPGGSFLYADLFWRAIHDTTSDEAERLMRRAGLEPVRHEDISANVFRARQLMSSSRLYLETIQRWMGADAQRAERAREFYSLSGSRAYEALKNGQLQYHCWVARKRSS